MDLLSQKISNKSAVIAINSFALLIYLLVKQIDHQRTGDGYIWIPGAIDFFGSIPESDGVHRPFFAFLAHLIFLVLKIFVSDSYTLSNIKNDRYSETYEIITGDPAIALLSWNILNFVCYILIVNLSYKAALLSVKEKDIAFYTSSLVAVSPEMVSWFFNTTIKIPGAVSIYLMWFLIANFFTNVIHKKKSSVNKYIILSGLAYGILMLGKAQYNVLISMSIFVILLAPSLIPKLFVFIVSQFIPLAFWLIVLQLQDNSYEVYEINRTDYSILNYWKENIILTDYTTWLDFLVIRPFYSFISSSTRGLGVFFTIILLIAIAHFYYNYVWGSFVLIYVLSTMSFLYLVNFALPRHTYEYGVIAYLYLSLFFFKLTKKIPKNLKTLFWILFVSLVFMLSFNRAGFLIGDTERLLPLL